MKVSRRKKIFHIGLLVYYLFYIIVIPVSAQEQVVSPAPETENSKPQEPVVTPEGPQENPSDQTQEPVVTPEVSPVENQGTPENSDSVSPTIEVPTPTTPPDVTNNQSGDVSPTPTLPPADKKPSSVDKLSDSLNDSGFVKGVGDSLDVVSNSISSTIKKITLEKATIHKLRDSVYSTNHPIEFIAEKKRDHLLKIEAKGSHGETYELHYSEDPSPDGFRITVLPPRSMVPGKYTLTVTDESGEQTKQDFLWGVLALNTNKSIYLPKQEALVDMAVLDETGEIVCDADLTLEILQPDSTKTDLTSKNKDIVVNEVCGKKEFTLEPDYAAKFTPEQIGTYKLKLTAVTKNGTYSIDDSFKVQENVDFDVERESATRLYPVLPYPMYITVKANKDFEGVITDTVPEVFDITSASEGEIFSSVLKSSDTIEDNTTERVYAADTNNLKKPYSGDHTITLGFGESYGIEELVNKILKGNNMEGHDGIDIDMPMGTEIYATDDGTVAFSGNGDYGKTIIISHVWGKSYYGHLKELDVKEGDEVSRGQLIGLSGNSGLSTGPHLHFSIKPNNADADNGYHGMIDPETLVSFKKESSKKVAQADSQTNSQADSKPKVLGTQTDNLFPTKVISWYVKLKKGDEIKLGYTYQSPTDSPAFYRIGKLTMIEQDIPEQEVQNPEAQNSETDITDSSTENFNTIRQTDSFKQALAKAQKTGNGKADTNPDSSQNTNGAVLAAQDQYKQPDPKKIVYQEDRFWQIAVDSVIVSGGITEAETQFGGLQRKVAYVNSNWYAFHNDGGKVYYQKSSNGTSWGGNVDVDSGDSDNYNPSIAVSNNIIHVFWIDDSGEAVEGRRINTASADAQGTLCTSANQGTLGSSFMVSIAQVSDTAVMAAYSDTSTDTEFDIMNISNLSGTCAFTDITPGDIAFGTPLSASDRPVLVATSNSDAMMVYQDGSNLKSAVLDSDFNEARENLTTIANVSDDTYSVASDGTNVWVLSKTSSTATKMYHYPMASTGAVQTSSAIDSDIGTSGSEGRDDVDITCPSATNCKIVYIDDHDTTTPALVFVDCDNADCSSFGTGTPREIDTDVGSSSEMDANPSIFCFSSGADCKIAYGDNLDTTTPDVNMIDCNDDDCDTPTITAVNADVGNGSSPKAFPEIYCISATDCQIVYLDNDLSSGSLVLADCGNATCSTVTNNTVQTNVNNGQTGSYWLQQDIWCIASGDCRIIYQDGTNTDIRYIDCSSVNCTGETPTNIDTTTGGTSVAQHVAIDCTGGSSDCKLIYNDSTDTETVFVDCDNAACSSSTETILDASSGNPFAASQVSLDCSLGATDCKGTWSGYDDFGNEKMYYFDCNSSATCADGNSVQLNTNARTKGVVVCPATDDCKIAYTTVESSVPMVRFADCTNNTCSPDWESLTAPWSSETNITSVSLTYDSTNTDLYASIIKDSSEQAYYKSTDSTTISWSSETSWAFTAGDLGHISASERAAGTGQVGVVLRQNANFEFAKLAGFTISGSCKQFDRSTNCTDSQTVKVAYDGTLQGDSTTTSSGTFSLEPAAAPTSGQSVTVFLQSVADANEAVAVTKYDGTGNISDMRLYADHVSFGSADNQTFVGEDLNNYDNTAGGEDIFYDIFLDGSTNYDYNFDVTSQTSQDTVYLVTGNTWNPETGTFQSDVAVTNVVTESSSTITGDDDDQYNVSGSWTMGGTFSSTCGATYPRVSFLSTSTGRTVSGNLNGSSDFCMVTFNGSGGGWTIQDPMLVSNANLTNTFNVTAGTVTLGNGGGDNLDVRGRFTISSGATFQTMSGLAQGDSTLCNTDDICIEINANSSPPSCTNCTIENAGTLIINTNATVRLNSNASVQSGINTSSTGYLAIIGTETDTGTDTDTIDDTTREGFICANESYTNDQHNNKYVRMSSGLAIGRIYPISDTIQSDSTNCATGTDDSLTINDTSSVTDSNPTVSCTGNKCVLTLSVESLISAADEGIGRYIHDKQGTKGYYLIIDSTESGSDTITVIGNPSTLALASGDDVSIVDGIRSGDTYQVLDFAEATAHTTNKGYITGAAGSETVMKYAKASYLGAETSLKYGIDFEGITGSNSSEGVSISYSYLHNNHRTIRADSSSSLNRSYTVQGESQGFLYNYILNATQDGVNVSSGNTADVIGNRVETVTGNGDCLAAWHGARNIFADNIVTSCDPGVYFDQDGGNAVINNKIYKVSGLSADGVTLDANSSNNIFVGNEIYSVADSGIGPHTAGTTAMTWYLAGNTIDIATRAVYMNDSTAGTILAANEKYGYYSGNSTADLAFSAAAHKARYYNSYFGSSTEAAGITTANSYLVSFKHDQTSGSNKLWNDFVIPDNVTETPQDEGTLKLNYADSTWDDSFSPSMFMGTGTQDNLEFAFSGGTLGGSANQYAYYIRCKAADCVTSPTNAWDVYRDGADIGDASTTSTFTDGTTNVQFKIDDAGTNPTRGAVYLFIVYQDPASTNTQKTLTLMQTSDGLTAGSGETIQLIGDSMNPTLIQKDSGSTGYDFSISGGTINANYYSFTGQAAAGLNISSGTVTNLSNGTFDNHAGVGLADTYITVAAAILNAGAQDWYNMIFDDSTTDSAVDKNVTLSGTPSACTNTWSFYSSGNKGGATNGEANDTDTGDAGACNGGNGYLLWYDNGPTNDQLMRHGEWFHTLGIRQPFTF